jgi:hypothetical protein
MHGVVALREESWRWSFRDEKTSGLLLPIWPYSMNMTRHPEMPLTKSYGCGTARAVDSSHGGKRNEHLSILCGRSQNECGCECVSRQIVPDLVQSLSQRSGNLHTDGPALSAAFRNSLLLYPMARSSVRRYSIFCTKRKRLLLQNYRSRRGLSYQGTETPCNSKFAALKTFQRTSFWRLL